VEHLPSLPLLMPRKKWSAKSDITPSLIKFREKRKWQISLRRYVLEKTNCTAYAPYFGLDIEKMRLWFEMQFDEDLSWENFANKWQFDHIIPVTYFDFSNEAELKMCWNFTNIRVNKITPDRDQRHHLGILAAKRYFQELFDKTHYKPCLALLQKIDIIELSEIVSTERQRMFILQNRPYLDMIENYSVFEFDLLNRGRTTEDLLKEVEFLKKF